MLLRIILGIADGKSAKQQFKPLPFADGKCLMAKNSKVWGYKWPFLRYKIDPKPCPKSKQLVFLWFTLSKLTCYINGGQKLLYWSLSLDYKNQNRLLSSKVHKYLCLLWWSIFAISLPFCRQQFQEICRLPTANQKHV